MKLGKMGTKEGLFMGRKNRYNVTRKNHLEVSLMLLWLFIFAGMLLAGVAGVIYLVRKMHRFRLPNALAGDRRALSALLVAVPFAVLWLVWGMMNAAICLLHLVVFWLLWDGVFWVVKKVRRRAFRRYYAGLVAILFTVGYLALGWYQANHVWQTNYTIQTDKAVGNLRIALVADSHMGTTFDGDGFAEHLKKVATTDPDVVVVVGDFVDEGSSKADMETAARALGQLDAPYGVYFVFGNHDKGRYSNGARGYNGDDLKAELTADGVTVLEDESVLLGGQFYLIGRQDASEEKDFDGSRASMSELTQSLDKDKYQIVLDHQPCDYDAQAQSGVDLVLSGHTHGGQLFPLRPDPAAHRHRRERQGLRHRDPRQHEVCGHLRHLRLGHPVQDRLLVRIRGHRCDRHGGKIKYSTAPNQMVGSCFLDRGGWGMVH